MNSALALRCTSVAPSSMDHPDVPPISYSGAPETRAFWGRNLPHWDVLGRPIFLTVHVRGAIPESAVRAIRAQAKQLDDADDSDYTRQMKRIFVALEDWLDRPDQPRELTRPGIAALLRDAIEHRAGRDEWRPLHWVIMPSHLHLLYVGGTRGMKALVPDFKRWTACRANEILGQEGAGFWQEEWFDHWSRSADETVRIAHYIRENPVRAGLVDDAADWPFASWAK